jgi:hypothetical protein
MGEKKPAPNLGKQKPRVSDDMWLTSRCQTIVNDYNAGTLDHRQAVAALVMVGNTTEQAEAILERHRGLPAGKVKPPKKPNPLRKMKR